MVVSAANAPDSPLPDQRRQEIGLRDPALDGHDLTHGKATSCIDGPGLVVAVSRDKQRSCQRAHQRLRVDRPAETEVETFDGTRIVHAENWYLEFA